MLGRKQNNSGAKQRWNLLVSGEDRQLRSQPVGLVLRPQWVGTTHQRLYLDLCISCLLVKPYPRVTPKTDQGSHRIPLPLFPVCPY